MTEPQPTTTSGSDGIEQSEKSFSTLLDEYQQDQTQEMEDNDQTPENDEEAEDSNSGEHDFDVDALKEELKKTRDVSIRKDQLRKEARAEAQQLQELLQTQVEANPEQILKIHERSPEIANEISKSLWDMPYDEFIAKAQGQSSQSGISKDDIRQEFESLFQERQQKEEQATIEDTEVQFFKGLGVGLDHPSMKNTMKEYQKFSPRNVEEAQIFLKAAYEKATGKNAPATVGNIADVPTVSSGRSSYQSSSKPKVSSKMKVAAKMFGISQKDLEAHFKK